MKTTLHLYTINVNSEYFINQLIYENNIELIYTTNVNSEYFINQLIYENNIELIYYQRKLRVFYQLANIMKITLHLYILST